MFVQIVTTCDDRDVLSRIANQLVAEQLAACVQTAGPIQSVYRWKGQVENSQEWMAIIKSTEDRVPAIEQTIQSMHPYDEPEILVTHIAGGSPGYLKWLAAQVRSDG